MINNTISHYKVLEKIAEGGMGVIYKAQDTKLKRIVVLKFLPPDLTRDAEAKERFIKEARAASALDHPSICTIYEIDETDDGQMFIAMACYQGQTVKEMIGQGPLKLEKAIDIAAQVAQGLIKAHGQGILHRDIKPGNILVTDDGRVKILDFGLAKLAGRTTLTKEGTTLGTVAYMSPQQTRGEAVDHRTDIWSLGVVLYEMLTGKQPFKGDYDQAVVYAILNEEPQLVTGLRTGVPLELERIINKALVKNLEERYQHVDELLADLRRLWKDLETPRESQLPKVVAKVAHKRRIRRISIPVGIVIFLVLGFLLRSQLVSEQVLVTEPRPIAVISFQNQTGDQTYDYLREAISNLLITNLEQSPYLRVTTKERMYDLIRQLGKEKVEVIDRDLGFELCQLEGIDAIVLGSFTKAGDIFATDVKVLDVRSKRLLKSASAKGQGVDSILKKQIEELSKDISRGVGLVVQRIERAQLQIAVENHPQP